jgi:ribosomal protein uL23
MAEKKETKTKDTKTVKKEEKKVSKNPSKALQNEVSKSWDVISFPYTTEKSMGLIEKENTLVFIVDKRANKTQIKESVEKAFGVKVDGVRTVITQKNFKKAFVKLNKSTLASEVAIRMGII